MGCIEVGQGIESLVDLKIMKFLFLFFPIGGWRVSPDPDRKSFRLVSFVRACAQAGCLAEFDLKSWL